MTRRLSGHPRVTLSVSALVLSRGGPLVFFYAGAMAAQELRWLTYLLTDFGERPRSPPSLTKHIALRYFLALELQQRGQLRLAYVAPRANTADVFTKALGSSDHQRLSTAVGLVPTLPHLLVA
ncbi:unnamed protein product [Closterium sp. NIES-53]